jgi:hypothetical protein
MDIATLLGPPPTVRLTMPSAETIATGETWVDYDRESDSFIIYFSAQPARGVHYDIDHDVTAIADPVTGQVLGIQIEAWERQFIHQFVDLNRVWPEFKSTISPGKNWSHPLRHLGVFVLSLLSILHNDESRLIPLPA